MIAIDSLVLCSDTGSCPALWCWNWLKRRCLAYIRRKLIICALFLTILFCEWALSTLFSIFSRVHPPPWCFFFTFFSFRLCKMGTFAKHRAFDQLFTIVNAYTQSLTSLIQMYIDSRGQIWIKKLKFCINCSPEIYFCFFYEVKQRC